MLENDKKKKRRRYGSYYWIDPKTKLGYAKVQIPTGEKLPNGKLKYKTLKKRADNATHADQLADEMFADHEKRGKGFITGAEMTFNDLSDWYEENRACPPVYSENGTKMSGMRTYKNVRLRIKRLKQFLGKIKIKNITEDTLTDLKKFIFNECQKEVGGSPKEASINRYLEDARAMFKTAVRKRWMKENPFDFGEKLIDSAMEVSREVTITKDQEIAILEAAKRAEKTLLYWALLCLLDTGARPSEIYDASTEKAEPVTWNDFYDLDFKAVRLTSYKGKQKKTRFGPVTERLKTALEDLYELKKKPEKSQQIFPVVSFKTTWKTTRREAHYFLEIAKNLKLSINEVFALDPEKIEKEKTKIKLAEAEAILKGKYEKPFILTVRMRDLRRNLSSKLAVLGIENDLRRRILGHELPETTFDYTAADLTLVKSISSALDNSMNDVQEFEGEN